MKFNIDEEEFVLDSRNKLQVKENKSSQEEPDASPLVPEPEPIKVEHQKPVAEEHTLPLPREEAESAEKQSKKEEKAEKKQSNMEKPVAKHPGGRPKKEITRKQYTLTLREDDYKKAMVRAAEEDISFAKLVEKALKQYLD